MTSPARRELVPVVALVLAICAGTAAYAAGAVSLDVLAATPRAVADGRPWLLVTSAFIADHPAGSLIALALAAAATLVACGPRVLWLSAAAGHVGSALVVYAGIGAIRVVDPDAFGRALTLDDFGVSAVLAAWAGALAATAWRSPAATSRRRVATVAACSLVWVVGWLFARPLSVLDSEHVVAFAIGIGLACAAGSARRAAIRLELPTAEEASC